MRSRKNNRMLRSKSFQGNNGTSGAIVENKIERIVAVLEVVKYASMCAAENRRLVRENRR